MDVDRQNCPICGKQLTGIGGVKKHIKRQHPDNKLTIQTVFHVLPIEDKKPLALHIYPKQEQGQTLDFPVKETEDYLEQYLLERDNHYDTEDFEKYKNKMIRAKDVKKKAKDEKNKPYEKPDDEVPGPSLVASVGTTRCHICKIKLPDREAREAHLNAKHPKCEECEDRFVDHDQANRHYETYHAPSKQPIICHVCQESFWKLTDFERHQVDHPQCPECGLRFLKKSELAKHRMVHLEQGGSKSKKTRSRETDYTCDLCSRRFKTAEEILRHQKRKHSHKCDQCRLSFATRNDLERHKRYHHSPLLQIKDKENVSDNKKSVVPHRGSEQQNVSVVDRQAIIDNDMRLLPRRDPDQDVGSDDSQSTIDNDTRLLPRGAQDVASDDSQATIDNDMRVLPRRESESDVGSDDSQETIDNDMRLLPRKTGISRTKSESPTLDDYNSETEVSVESIDESPRPIKDETASGDSQVTIDSDLRIIPRDDKLELDQGVPLVDYSDRSGDEKLDIKKEPESDNSQSTIDNDTRIAPRDDRLKPEQDMPLVGYSEHSDEEKRLIKDETSSDDSQTTIDNDTRIVPRDVSSELDKEMPLVDYSDNSEPIDKDGSASDVTVIEKPIPRLDFNSSSDEVMDVEQFKHSQVERCPICGQRFLRRSWLKRHISNEHKVSRNENEEVNPIRSSQLVKCPICYKKFGRKSILDEHIKSQHKKNKHHAVQCKFCEETPIDMSKHLRSEHFFSCKLCRERFKFQTLLTDHISMQHPSCDKCGKTYLSKRELLKHQKEHPENEFIAEISSHESDDGLDNSGTDPADSDDPDDPEIERKDYEEHINCVTVKRFSIIKQLISKNDFKSLAKDTELLESLGIIMNGVKRGFIPLCSGQKKVLTNRQKNLVYVLARNPSGQLVMKERRDLSLLFDVLWKSVKYVSDVFQNYDR